MQSESRFRTTYRVQAHGFCMEQSIVSHSRERAVRMHHGDALPDKHTAQEWHAVEEGGGGGLVVHHLQRQVVDLKAIGQVPDALPVAVSVRDYHHLVSLLDQTLGQEVNVTLHSSHVRVEEVRDYADAVLSPGSFDGLCCGSRYCLGCMTESCCPSSVAHCTCMARNVSCFDNQKCHFINVHILQ